jgi:hypothetical protein
MSDSLTEMEFDPENEPEDFEILDFEDFGWGFAAADVRYDEGWRDDV